MTQVDTTLDCRQLEETRAAAAEKLQHITAALAADPELGDSWWGTLYDITAKAIRDIEAAMLSVGCDITSQEACNDLEAALSSVRTRIDAVQQFMFADPEVAYARQPDATYAALLSELRHIEATMLAAGCALPGSTPAAVGRRATVRLAAYLRDHLVPFQVAHHRPAYTAQAVAASERLPGELMAKVVMVFADGKAAMLVLPATHRVDFAKAAAVLGVRQVRLANEHEFAAAFPDCDVGAMPPFGELYGLPVYVDEDLAADETIVCQAGTHTDTLSLRYSDFAKLVQPKLGRICTREQ